MPQASYSNWYVSMLVRYLTFSACLQVGWEWGWINLLGDIKILLMYHVAPTQLSGISAIILNS